MLQAVKELVKKSFLFPILKPLGDKLLGSSLSDPLCWELIIDYGKKFDIQCLIETGTHLGNTMAATKNYFSSLYSIELSEVLAKNATERFKEDPHVKIICGDSGKVLPKLLPSIQDRKILFWLDAHYSMGVTAKGETLTPIVDEIKSIFKCGKEVVILIDDARDFSWYNVVFRGRNDYPTISALKNLIKELDPTYKVMLSEGVIRIHK